MKGKHLLYMASPQKDVEAYVLQANPNTKGKKYTILMWKNPPKNARVTPATVTGIRGNVSIEQWNLDVENKADISQGIKVDDKPIAIYTDEKPDWQTVNKSSFAAKLPAMAVSRSPMPNDK